MFYVRRPTADVLLLQNESSKMFLKSKSDTEEQN